MGVHHSESVYISTAVRNSGGQVVIEHAVALAVSFFFSFLFFPPRFLLFFFARKDEEIQKRPGRMNADGKALWGLAGRRDQ